MSVVSPFQGLVFVILFTQGDAARLTPKGSRAVARGGPKPVEFTQPVEFGYHDHRNRPGGAKESSCPLSCDLAPPLRDGNNSPTPFRGGRRSALHLPRHSGTRSALDSREHNGDDRGTAMRSVNGR